MREASFTWFAQGRLNAAYNCVDRHAQTQPGRLGTAEIESALVAHDAVSEAAVVGYPHALKGTGICGWVTVRSGSDWSQLMLAGALRETVRQAIGPIASPDRIVFVPQLPKTRSGKIMRRIPRKVASGEEDLGDTSTLAEETVVRSCP